MERFKLLTIVISSVTVLTSFKLQTNYIEPTGTYKLVSKVKVKSGDTYGYSGQIQVKKITNDRIIINFYVNKGAPSYNSGDFIDTLNYINNVAIYTTPEYDSTCKITFTFDKKGISVKQEAVDINFGCGFGQGVDAYGFYKRVSNKIPKLIDLTTGKEVD